MKHATLCLLQRYNPNRQILLGLKKRGFGAGKWVGIGGGIELGEDIFSAAIRELAEEIRVYTNPNELNYVAQLSFKFPAKSEWDHLVEVFFVNSWQGDPLELDEIQPAWFFISEIPYCLMWSDAVFWLPPILEGNNLRGDFIFATDNQNVARVILEKK